MVFFKYKYNVNTCMYTISPLYQIINFNVSTWYLKPLNIKCDRILQLEFCEWLLGGCYAGSKVF